MADDAESLRKLESIQTGVAETVIGMRRLSVEMRTTRKHIAGLAALQDHDHVEIAQIKLRLDRLERRLGERE